MASTRFSIIMDYRNAMAQADAIDSLIAELRSDCNRLNGCNDRINIYWKGDNALKYKSKVVKTTQNISQIIKDLSNISATIKRIAKRTYDTEMATLEISRNRTY